MRVGIVTGGSKGIGKGLTLALASAHPELDEIWVVSRNPAWDEESPGPRIRCIAIDLAQHYSTGELSIHLDREGATVEFLVCNAGVAIASTRDFAPSVDSSGWADASMSADESMVNTNILGTLRVVNACLPHMVRGSKVLLIGSISALVPTPGLATYTASKAFVRSWSLALREELRPLGISVTVSHPGKVRTEAVAGVVRQTGSIKLRAMPSQSLRHFARRSIAAADRGKDEVTPGFYRFFTALVGVIPAPVRARLSRL
nr:SDR family NAD(P)-dependent oxidoreductase [Corynebacterium lactis]